jgi:hypothetical protein
MAIDLNDKTTNGNNLTNNGADEITSSLPFTASLIAVDLEASESDYLSVADSSSLSITGNMTIEFWFKPESQPATDDNFSLLSKFKFTGSNDRSYNFFYADVGGTKVLGGAISDDGTNTDQRTVNQSLTNGTWYHLAMTITPANAVATEFEWFLDGSSIGNGDTTDADDSATAIYDGVAQLNIGARDNGGSKFADGQFDDVRIWNDIRTSTEINNNKSLHLSGNEANLVAYWPFESLAGGFDLTSKYW